MSFQTHPNKNSCNIPIFLIKFNIKGLYVVPNKRKLNIKVGKTMNDDKNVTINTNTIIKILYKNLFLICGITSILVVLSALYAFNSKSYKADIVLYGNDRILNEIGENSQFSLNSFDFFLFIKNNSKELKNTGVSEKKFLEEISDRLNAQSETGDPTIKVKFSSKDEKEVENFSREYIALSEKYLLYKKNLFLDNQIKLLEEQYNFLSNNVDLRTTKDSLSDTLVSRLAFYRLLKNDTNPIVRLVSLNIGPALNKKIVLAGGLFTGLFLGILVAFFKEFSKTLDWKYIKDKNMK